LLIVVAAAAATAAATARAASRRHLHASAFGVQHSFDLLFHFSLVLSVPLNLVHLCIDNSSQAEHCDRNHHNDSSPHFQIGKNNSAMKKKVG
jgi:hypothetical protein